MADEAYQVDVYGRAVLTFDVAEPNPYGHARGCYCSQCYGVYYPQGSPNLNHRDRVEAARLAGLNTRNLNDLALRNLGAPEAVGYARAAAGEAATAAHHQERLLQCGNDLPGMATQEHAPLRATCWEHWATIEGFVLHVGPELKAAAELKAAKEAPGATVISVSTRAELEDYARRVATNCLGWAQEHDAVAPCGAHADMSVLAQALGNYAAPGWGFIAARAAQLAPCAAGCTCEVNLGVLARCIVIDPPACGGSTVL
ncbi:hypothetical protein GQ42DRAFT_165119 [Ramicandelaber brevisporus]|nr:hypothetical protein GQ42DRAFT_165119 [Ramicandelaber brevisporus]